MYLIDEESKIVEEGNESQTTLEPSSSEMEQTLCLTIMVSSLILNDHYNSIPLYKYY